DMLALALLVVLAWPTARPRLTLLTATCYALLPFAAEFGGRAFYHHFSVVLMLATLVLGKGLFGEPHSVRIVPTSLCAGLACAACYWLWWLPLSWAVLLAWKRPRGWIKGLFWTVVPPLAALALNVLPDPQGAWWSIRGMLRAGAAGVGGGAAGWLSAVKTDFAILPFLGIGLLGLAWAAFTRRGPWVWFLFCLACAILEPMRQRGAGSVDIPYPYQLAAPLAALGAAALADKLLAARSRAGLCLAIAALALFFLPVNLDLINRLGFNPTSVSDLKDFLDTHSKPGDLVCGLPAFNWDLRPRLRVCDPYDLTAAEGRPTNFYPAGIPAHRFAFPCGPDAIRYAVTTTMHLYFIFRSENVALSFLELEQAGWPLVFSSPSFRVYENPRFGLKPDPTVRILQTPAAYELARGQAIGARLPDLAALAEKRLRSLGDPFHTAGAAI
ncbi:MAG: hypothetical protein ACREKE_07530, partial [bacterium]